ncbi:MAG: PCMD domain-containing protein [Bacteroidales bacterium]|nr:PCMD domain-containing protein [Bacteroidales bacterium]
MKKTLLITLALALPLTASYGQKIEKVPFGDFENWTVRYIKESSIIGGETKVNYVIAPTDTIRQNAPYNYSKTIWGSSNAYAVVMGVTKVTCSVTPDKGPTGRCAKLENTMVSVKAAGMISVNVLATGAIYWGKMLEPITSTNNPMTFLDWGIPFTKRPVAVIVDFKAYLPNTGKIKKGNKDIDGYDPEQIMFILQNRSKDAGGKTHVTRVGTAVHRIEKSTDGWVRNFRIPVIYGDATKDKAYKSYMNLMPKNTAPMPEEAWGNPDTPVTHAYFSCSSGTQSDLSGAVGNILWIDNVRLEY